MEYTDIHGARALRCVADGRVLTLGELHDGMYSRRLLGDGYAVMAAGGMAAWLTEQLLSPAEVEILSPADGVVTSAEEFLSIRTGDGIGVTVYLGNTDTEFIPQVGERLRCGERLCTVPREALRNNGINGAAVVLFNDMERVTELHISTGRKKAGDRTAFYRLRGM